MEGGFEFWRLAAGLGLFLFGMHLLEQALKALAGRPFKRFLKSWTSAPPRGVIAGAVATAALQSSSVVSLIVLAFVGAGIVSLASAIAIVFGSNVGTTATGWIVATIGFRLDIEALALPLVALGGFIVVWTRTGSRAGSSGLLIVGLGLMLTGLEFMKTGTVAATALFDPEKLAGYPLLVFVAAGFLITAIIQSSSATIMITLSALYAGAITLPAAAAVAIGADLGTSITAILGALAGSMDKKRVAAAIVLFNVVANVVALIFIYPLLTLVTDVFGISDPLLALVAFHSLFNTVGVLIFLPFIPQLARWLTRRFAGEATAILRHISPDSEAVPEAALENIDRETLRLIDQCAALNQVGFGLPPDATFYDSAADRDGVRLFASGADPESCYRDVKQLEGEILGYALALSRAELEPEESTRLGQIIPALRNAVHAAKSVRDLRHDLASFRDSVNDRFNAWSDQFREAVRGVYEMLPPLKDADLEPLRFEALVEFKNEAERLHERLHHRVYAELGRGELSEIEISTLLNVNRELYVSNQSLIAALADALLSAEAADDFEAIPVAR